MSTTRRVWLAGGGLLGAIALAVLLTAGPPPPAVKAPGTFAFAALGDAPYYYWQDLRYPLALEDIRAHDLEFVLHVGDIFWRPCSDAMYRRTLGWFASLPFPVVYTPGDNEWFNCGERGSGAYVPAERLQKVRKLFFARPAQSLGGRPMALASQSGREPYPEFVENARWSRHGIVFATVHLVGRNDMTPTTPEDETAVRRQVEAAAAWLRETFAEANAAGAPAVVVGFQANAALEEPAGDPYRQAFEPFLTALEEEVQEFGKPVVVIHGDGHEYTVDRPLVRRTTGRRLENLTRVQVPGAPALGWVRVAVTPGEAASFEFEPRVVPMWRVW